MLYIFLDESGDLGFSEKSSKWFLFTIAMISDVRALERVVKKIWRPLRKKHKKLGELHAYHADNITRTRLIRGLAEISDLKVVSVILNKTKVHVDLSNQKNYLYNYTANILLDRLHSNGLLKDHEKIELYIDRKDTKKKLRDNLIQYLTSSMNDRGHVHFSVKLHSSQDNKSLQAVDFISWALFRKYEKGDYEFYELIKSKIVDERLLFP